MYQTTQKEIFHVHTWRCKHAGDYQDEEYIEKAIELGAGRIVFTDHGPFPGNPFGNRMDYEQLPEYIESMQRLKELYKNKIVILCGLEIEYLPSYTGYIEELRNMPGIDVMVLGQHFYEHEPGKYSFSDEDKSMEYEGLCDAMIQGLESCCFDVVAHPDRVFRRNKQFGEKTKKATQKFLDVAKNLFTMLERNFSSTHQMNHYRKEFWDMVPYMQLVFGFDAHSPEEMEAAWQYRLHFTGQSFTKLSEAEKKLAMHMIAGNHKLTVPELSEEEIQIFRELKKKAVSPIKHMTASKYFAICRCVYDAIGQYEEELYDDELYCLYKYNNGISVIKDYESEEEFNTFYRLRSCYHIEEICYGKVNLILHQNGDGYDVDLGSHSGYIYEYQKEWITIFARAYINCWQRVFPVHLTVSETDVYLE